MSVVGFWKEKLEPARGKASWVRRLESVEVGSCAAQLRKKIQLKQTPLHFFRHDKTCTVAASRHPFHRPSHFFGRLVFIWSRYKTMVVCGIDEGRKSDGILSGKIRTPAACPPPCLYPWTLHQSSHGGGHNGPPLFRHDRRRRGSAVPSIIL